MFNLTLLVVNAYAAAMVGRLRNLPLTFAGSLGLGLLSSYAVGYLPTSGFWGSTPMQGLRLSIPVLTLFVVLLVLPSDTIEHGRLAARRAAVAVPTFGRSVFGGVALVLGAVIATAVVPSAQLQDVGVGLAMGLVLLSLVPLTGWGGQVSLCQMTFAGLGAFAMYKLGHGGSVWGLVAALGLAGAVGALIGLFTLRFRGLYLALATMAFAVAMDNMFFPAPSVFTFDGSVPIPRPSLFGLHVNSQHAYVIFLAVVFALLSIGLLALRRGPFGRLLSASKDSQAACVTLGLNLTTTKLAVFAAVGRHGRPGRRRQVGRHAHRGRDPRISRWSRASSGAAPGGAVRRSRPRAAPCSEDSAWASSRSSPTVTPRSPTTPRSSSPPAWPASPWARTPTASSPGWPSACDAASRPLSATTYPSPARTWRHHRARRCRRAWLRAPTPGYWSPDDGGVMTTRPSTTPRRHGEITPRRGRRRQDGAVTRSGNRLRDRPPAADLPPHPGIQPRALGPARLSGAPPLVPGPDCGAGPASRRTAGRKARNGSRLRGPSGAPEPRRPARAVRAG